MNNQTPKRFNPTILFFNANSSDGNNLKQEIESREREFFERKMSEYGQPLKAGNNSGLKNPFYDDKNGSMSIYMHENKWFFNDFGDDRYKGDVFTFAGFVYSLDSHSNFMEILKKMAVDLNISIEESKNDVSESNAIIENDYDLTKSPLLNRPTIERTFDDFFEDERNMQPPLGGAACASHQEQLKVEYSEMFDYWYQFGNRDKMNKTLGKFNVRNIKRIQSEKATLEEKPDSPIYGFVFSSDCIKTYAPFEPKDKGKHLWFGEKPDNHVDIFGFNQLPQKGGLLFIVEGYKDCITANANDILSIGVDNASTKIPSKIIDDLKKRFTVVVVMYDNDEAGIRGSTKIAHEHGLVNLILPKSVKGVEFGKDISDYLEAGLPVKHVVELALELHSKHSMEIENAKYENLQTESNESDCIEQKKDFLLSTPFIPESCYKNLPQLLKDGTSVFEKGSRDRDVFFTSYLAILSGCLPNVEGLYDHRTIYPPFFVFIVAPPANGKGAMTYAKETANVVHDKMKEVSDKEQEQYELEVKSQGNNNSDIPKDKALKQPPYRILFIPGNVSYAKLLQHLSDNQDSGIICETEADTIGNALKKEWGNYSDLLRKAYHNERISSSKKNDNEYIEVKTPKLAVCISGTPSQVIGLVPSAEDGLFSRFTFYVYKNNLHWRDVSPNENNLNYSEYFKSLSNKVYELNQFLKQHPTTVELTKNQWETLNKRFSDNLAETCSFAGEIASSIVLRLGQILFRVCMIFTALRKFENGDSSEVVYCLDSDFQTASELCDIYQQHSLLLLNNLPKSSHNDFKSGTNKQMFSEALPPFFKRNEAVEIGKSFNISEHSVDNYLKQMLKNGVLAQPAYGAYMKRE